VLVAAIWNATVLPTLTLAAVALVITGAARVMVSVSVPVPIPSLLVALRVTADVPPAVGVPEINPVPLFIVKPAGIPVAP
jgi:hypothetical protein